MSEPISEKVPFWAEHMRRYLATGGRDGHLWDATPVGGLPDTPTLLLTTTGRHSGKQLTLPLIYGHTPEGLVIVASKGGAPAHPAWYLNLETEPTVEVQVLDRKFRARARTASGEERGRLWDHMVEVYPPYADYQTQTDREIPVVVLEALD